MSSWLRPRSQPSGRWTATTARASYTQRVPGVGLAMEARPPHRWSRLRAGRRRRPIARQEAMGSPPAAPWAAQRLGGTQPTAGIPPVGWVLPGTQPRVFCEVQRFGQILSKKTRSCRFAVQRPQSHTGQAVLPCRPGKNGSESQGWLCLIPEEIVPHSLRPLRTLR